MLMQTMMLKVWAKRLELINDEELRIASEDSEHYELEQESANIAELKALFPEAAADDSSTGKSLSNLAPGANLDKRLSNACGREVLITHVIAVSSTKP